MAWGPHPYHCLFLWIKFYWNTGLIILLLSVIAFRAQWGSRGLLAETCSHTVWNTYYPPLHLEDFPYPDLRLHKLLRRVACFMSIFRVLLLLLCFVSFCVIDGKNLGCPEETYPDCHPVVILFRSVLVIHGEWDRQACLYFRTMMYQGQWGGGEMNKGLHFLYK